jgi:hypothetical protein
MRLGPMIGTNPDYGLPIGPMSVGARALADLRFAAGGFGLGGSTYGALTDVPGFTFARASAGRSLDGTLSFASGVPRIVPGLGILIEEARTNRFLNSAAPVTQDVTITAVAHTITVWGPGSVEVTAGTATISNGGAVTAGSPRTIGCTVGGTITVTVTGSPTYVQVEAGAFGTSPIVTEGTAVTRAADLLTLAAVRDLLVAPQGTLVFDYTITGSVTVPTRFADAGVIQLYSGNDRTFVITFDNNITRAQTTPAATLNAAAKAAFTWSPSVQAVCVDGGTVASVAYVASGSPNALAYIGNRAAGDRALNGYIARIRATAGTSTDAQLQGVTV